MISTNFIGEVGKMIRQAIKDNKPFFFALCLLNSSHYHILQIFLNSLKDALQIK